MKKLTIGILVLVSVLLVGCGSVPAEKTPNLSASEVEAVREYANAVISKLDILYVTFEDGEAQAKKIADERTAPYQMAIGSMAEVRKTAGEVQALSVPFGAEAASEAAISKLQGWQNGLDEIAKKGPSEVSLTDPGEFYIAYLDVLIEIPEVKAEVRSK